MKKLDLPASPVAAVRADTPIEQCVRYMRDRAIGALVIVSDDIKEEVVGIFTERDLLKEIELIQKGGFWTNPIRSVMTSKVKTISPEQLHLAPKLMASLNIRHLPIVAKRGGRSHLIGVISMRDIFRTVMERYDFQIDKILNPWSPAATRRGKRLLGFFTADSGLSRLLGKAGKLTKRLVVSAGTITDKVSAADLIDDFDAICIDLDQLPEDDARRAVELGKVVAHSIPVLIIFQPVTLSRALQVRLQEVGAAKNVKLISKPVAFGILYEHFLKGF